MSIHNEALLKDSGIPHLEDAEIILVHTQWNNFIVDEMTKGCVATLDQFGVKNLTILEVPGTFELPFACKRSFEEAKNKGKNVDAIIAFGCVIRGETPHFDYVCEAATDGITQLNITLPVPIIFGVLTVDNVKQAQERIGGKHGHKGKEAALSALKMIAFNRKLKGL